MRACEAFRLFLASSHTSRLLARLGSNRCLAAPNSKHLTVMSSVDRFADGVDDVRGASQKALIEPVVSLP
jgi:hypothetical protein